MARRFQGVTERRRKSGKVYELYFNQNGRRVNLEIVSAGSMAEAFDVREERRLEFLQKQNYFPKTERDRFNADFEVVWEDLKGNLWELHKNTIKGIRATYNRMFFDFRENSFPHVTCIGNLSVRFFLEYKRYFITEIDNPREETKGRPKGWRAEVIRIKNIMNRLRDLDYCSRDLMESFRKSKALKTPKPRPPEYNHVEKKDLERLLEYVREDRPDYYDIIYYLYWTGRRIGETTKLERRDVVRGNPKRGLKPIEIKIRREICKIKEEDPDPAPLPLEWSKDLQNHIEKVLSQNKGPYLFPNKYGRKCTPNRLRDYLNRVSLEICGSKITPHQFRRNLVTTLLGAGMGEKDVMAITGHRDSEVLHTHYAFTTKRGRQKAYDFLKFNDKK